MLLNCVAKTSPLLLSSSPPLLLSSSPLSVAELRLNSAPAEAALVSRRRGEGAVRHRGRRPPLGSGAITALAVVLDIISGGLAGRGGRGAGAAQIKTHGSSVGDRLPNGCVDKTKRHEGSSARGSDIILWASGGADNQTVCRRRGGNVSTTSPSFRVLVVLVVVAVVVVVVRAKTPTGYSYPVVQQQTELDEVAN
ncbi:hypothetical protein EYF80_066493 [Liparis tanakae]|uniref:Uncharacterized protein n=1 Tax=Liparis tanakae TaxID=230148 RepID=A0A4Z2E3T7_9TELE|nr:hypothetical protein EYF80_066493 [Liparis tanakae]